jgi:hypothetical protein
MTFSTEDMFIRSQPVLHKAIARLGVKQNTELYDELFAAASEFYLNWLNRYTDPLETELDRERCNRLAGNIIYKQLLKIQVKTRRNWAKFNQCDLDDLVMNGNEPVSSLSIPGDGLVSFDAHRLLDHLSYTDLRILNLLLQGRYTNRKIAARLDLSEATVSRKHRKLRQQLTNILSGDEA